MSVRSDLSDLADECSKFVGLLADLRDGTQDGVCEEAALALRDARGCLDDVIEAIRAGTVTDPAGRLPVIRRVLWRLLGARRLPADSREAVRYLDELAANAGMRWEREQRRAGDAG